MAQPGKDARPDYDLEVEALLALERARAMPHGPERSEALKNAGRLQRAADTARTGRPPAKP